MLTRTVSPCVAAQGGGHARAGVVGPLISPGVNAAPPPAPLAGRRCVQYINRSYGRTGTLWDGRYKSALVQAETYLLFCQRYVELNPVRAGRVSDPAHYAWSS
jgi:putative transposase